MTWCLKGKPCQKKMALDDLRGKSKVSNTNDAMTLKRKKSRRQITWHFRGKKMPEKSDLTISNGKKVSKTNDLNFQRAKHVGKERHGSQREILGLPGIQSQPMRWSPTTGELTQEKCRLPVPRLDPGWQTHRLWPRTTYWTTHWQTRMNCCARWYQSKQQYPFYHQDEKKIVGNSGIYLGRPLVTTAPPSERTHRPKGTWGIHIFCLYAYSNIASPEELITPTSNATWRLTWRYMNPIPDLKNVSLTSPMIGRRILLIECPTCSRPARRPRRHQNPNQI